MDLFLNLLLQVWRLFTSTSFPVTFQGVEYEITLIGIFLFTTVTVIVGRVVFSMFD